MTQTRRILDLLAAGEAFCLITIIASARRDLSAGRKAVVLADGKAGAKDFPADFPAALEALGRKALEEKRCRMAEVEPGVQAFLDVFPAEAALLICGAGHIAVPLALFAREAGFRVTVLDDRPDFASRDRFPGCEVIAEDFTAALRGMPFGPSAYAVVITRGHEHDSECLAEILLKRTAYTGLIGSRRRVAFVLGMLEKKGIPGKRLGEVFTPIGVPIGAESPEEIALSIAAELVCVRRKGPAAARALRDAAGGAK